MNSFLNYSGKVQITAGNSKFVFENNGTKYLFNLLTGLLAQKTTTTSNSMPCFIDIVTQASSRDNKESILYSPMFIVDKVTDNTDDNSSCIFTALLNKSNIKDDEKEKLYITLLSANKTTVLAEAEITDTSFIKMNDTQQSVVSWKLTFSNSKTQGGSN